MRHAQVRYAGRKLLIAAAIAALLGTDAEAAPAGTVDFAIGNVTATGTDGRARPVVKGVELNAGDRIVTNDGRAQIRFADGAFVSLQPDTDFAIREYRFDGKADGSERGFFGLVKGAMRTVTGAIGRVNRNAYQIQTPTATIGIRGTGGVIRVNADTSTDLVGTSGIWSVIGVPPAPGTPPPQTEVPGGQAIRSTPQGQIQQLAQGPVVPPAPMRAAGQKLPGEPASPWSEAGLADGNNPGGQATSDIGTPVNSQGGPEGITNSSGQPLILPPPVAGPPPPVAGPPPPPPPPPPPNPNPPLVSGSGYDLSYASGGATPFAANEGQTAATFDAAGRLTASNGPSGNLTLNGSQAQFGTAGGVVAWGRWTGVTSTVTAVPSQAYGPNDGFHYVVGVPAPITALGGTGTVTYNLAGATSPTNGATTGTVTGGQLVANLGPSPTVNLQNLSVNIAGSTYVMSKAGMPITGPLTPFSGTLSSFAGDFAGTTGGCLSTCNATVNGHFYGTGASHAGIAYKLQDSFPTSQTVTGAAAFAK